MIIEKGSNPFVFTTKIEFPNPGNEKETEFVELREFNTAEKYKLMKAGEVDEDGNFKNVVEVLKVSGELFASCVVDSSFVDENGNKLSGDIVASVLKASSTTFDNILSYWVNSKNPFHLLQKKTEN